MKVFQFLQTLQNMTGLPCGHVDTRASDRIASDIFTRCRILIYSLPGYFRNFVTVPCWTLWVQTLSAPVFWWAPLASPCAEMSERVTADWSILRPWKVARLSPVDFFCRMEDFCSVFKMRIWILSKISKILSKHVLQRAGGGFVLVSGIGLRNLMGSLYRMTTKLTNDE